MASFMTSFVTFWQSDMSQKCQSMSQMLINRRHDFLLSPSRRPLFRNKTERCLGSGGGAPSSKLVIHDSQLPQWYHATHRGWQSACCGFTLHSQTGGLDGQCQGFGSSKGKHQGKPLGVHAWSPCYLSYLRFSASLIAFWQFSLESIVFSGSDSPNFGLEKANSTGAPKSPTFDILLRVKVFGTYNCPMLDVVQFVGKMTLEERDAKTTSRTTCTGPHAPGLIQLVLTVLVFWPWVQLVPGSQPLPQIVLVNKQLLHGPLNICLDLLPTTPLPLVQKRAAQHKLLQHKRTYTYIGGVVVMGRARNDNTYPSNMLCLAESLPRWGTNCCIGHPERIIYLSIYLFMCRQGHGHVYPTPCPTTDCYENNSLRAFLRNSEKGFTDLKILRKEELYQRVRSENRWLQNELLWCFWEMLFDRGYARGWMYVGEWMHKKSIYMYPNMGMHSCIHAQYLSSWC